MFKGFGKPSNEEMVASLVNESLAYYKHLSKCAAQEGQETSQVLAQAVMRFSKDANTNDDESAINYGRVCVGLAVNSLVENARENGNERLLNLKDTLQFLVSTPVSVLHQMGV